MEFLTVVKVCCGSMTYEPIPPSHLTPRETKESLIKRLFLAPRVCCDSTPLRFGFELGFLHYLKKLKSKMPWGLIKEAPGRWHPVTF